MTVRFEFHGGLLNPEIVAIERTASTEGLEEFVLSKVPGLEDNYVHVGVTSGPIKSSGHIASPKNDLPVIEDPYKAAVAKLNYIKAKYQVAA